MQTAGWTLPDCIPKIHFLFQKYSENKNCRGINDILWNKWKIKNLWIYRTVNFICGSCCASEKEYWHNWHLAVVLSYEHLKQSGRDQSALASKLLDISWTMRQCRRWSTTTVLLENNLTCPALSSVSFYWCLRSRRRRRRLIIQRLELIVEG